MVEGHQCHRVGHAHRKQLLGQRFTAQSPNGRFTEGTPQHVASMQSDKCSPQAQAQLTVCKVHATSQVFSKKRLLSSQPYQLNDRKWTHLTPKALHPICAGAQAINQQPLTRIEVHGKNLFYFFGEADATVVLHIHFGMSGAFRTIARGDTLPEPRETTRLVLIGDEIVGQLSAMIVQHGGLGEQAEQTQHSAQCAQPGFQPLFDAQFEACTLDRAVLDAHGNLKRTARKELLLLCGKAHVTI